MFLLYHGGLLKRSHRGSQEMIDQLPWILQDSLGALAERRKSSLDFFWRCVCSQQAESLSGLSA